MKKSIIKGITAFATSIMLLATTMPLNGVVSYPSSVNATTASTVAKNKTSSKTLKVTQKDQKYKKWCNVACAQMMLDYYKVTATQEDIYRKAINEDKNYKLTQKDYDDWINSGKTKNAINSLMGTKKITSTTAGCNFSGIKNKIDINKPVILEAKFTSANENLEGREHAVICYGYSINGKEYSLFVHDPDKKRVTTLKASSNSATAFKTTYKNAKNKTVTDTVAIQAIIYDLSRHEHK